MRRFPKNANKVNGARCDILFTINFHMVERTELETEQRIQASEQN